MCRHLGYVGPPVNVGELVLRGPHSLFVQSWAPADMRGGGTINADGFGIAWWRRAEVGRGVERPAVTRYRNAAPIWTDPAVAEVLGQLESGSVLAAVRSATVGMPVERAACAPFTDEHWSFSHNGVIPDWRPTLLAVRRDLREFLAATPPNTNGAMPSRQSGVNGVSGPGGDDAGALRQSGVNGVTAVPGTDAAVLAGRSGGDGMAGIDAAGQSGGGGVGRGDSRPGGALLGADEVLLTAEALTDSAVLWVLLRGLLDAIHPNGPVTSPGDALRLLVTTVLQHQPTARLNLLLGDGDRLWATTCWHALSVLVADDHTILASEPYDTDPRWHPIPDRQLITAAPGHCTITALESPATEGARV